MVHDQLLGGRSLGLWRVVLFLLVDGAAMYDLTKHAGTQPQFYLHSTAPIDTWDTGGTMVTIAGSFAEECLDGSSTECRYAVGVGPFAAPLVPGYCNAQKIVVLSPAIADGRATADYDVRVTLQTRDGASSALRWSSSAQPIRQKIRIHNYRTTVAQQKQVSEAAQLQLLSPSTVPAFAEVVMLKLFHSAARSDHTLCGIGGDSMSMCPSLDGDYKMVRLEGLCHRLKREGMVPLRFYWSAAHVDNAVTAAKKLRPDPKGYELVRNVCYIWRNGGADRSPLDLFYSAEHNDHYATGTAVGRKWAKANNYTSMGTQGFVERVPLRSPSKLDGTARGLLESVDAIVTRVNAQVNVAGASGAGGVLQTGVDAGGIGVGVGLN